MNKATLLGFTKPVHLARKFRGLSSEPLLYCALGYSTCAAEYTWQRSDLLWFVHLTDNLGQYDQGVVDSCTITLNTRIMTKWSRSIFQSMRTCFVQSIIHNERSDGSPVGTSIIAVVIDSCPKALKTISGHLEQTTA